MRIILFSMCLIVSSLAYCQKPSDPIILRTADDVSRIQTANDWILVTTTQTGADHDADLYLKEYEEIMQAVDRRLLEIHNLNSISKQIKQCLIDHKLATNKNKFTVAQLREYAKEYHSRELTEDFIKEANETKLVQALQELYK